MCSADALSQVCQDLYSTYVDTISAQTAFILSQNILQPQQLTESYLAGVSGDFQCTLYRAVAQPADMHCTCGKSARGVLAKYSMLVAIGIAEVFSSVLYRELLNLAEIYSKCTSVRLPIQHRNRYFMN